MKSNIYKMKYTLLLFLFAALSCTEGESERHKLAKAAFKYGWTQGALYIKQESAKGYNPNPSEMWEQRAKDSIIFISMLEE